MESRTSSKGHHSQDLPPEQAVLPKPLSHKDKYVFLLF